MRLLSIRQLRFAALIAGIGLLVVMLPQAHEIESRVGLNALFHLRGVTAPPNDVVIIAINRSVATALDLPASPDRWPRSVYAQLIDRLAEAGASVIAIDLLFRDATERVSDT
ncbi:MAG TPA: CHASE2 domain-containing protein, partial [Motiliproteus sp.]